MSTNSSAEYAAHHFNDALRLYRDAHREMAVWSPAEDDDDESERKADALTAAEDYLLAHNAPDWRALLAKIEVASLDGRLIGHKSMDDIKADIMRLAGIDRSPTFDPFIWANEFEYRGGSINRKGDKAVLSCSIDNSFANRMMRKLKPHEREALADYLAANREEA